MKRMKKGIILHSLDDETIKRAFEFIERKAPCLTRGMIYYKNNAKAVKDHLKSYDVPSLSWYDDDDFLYWGHENFIIVKWDNFLGEL